MSSRPWRFLSTGIKLAVAGALIAYVLLSGKLDLRNVGRLLSEPAYFVSAFLILTLQLFLTAWRLKRLLRVQTSLPFAFVLRLTYVGAFFDAFSFTSVGGDAVKAWYLAHEIPAGRKTEAVSVLVVDRFLGLLGLLSLTAFAVLLNFPALWAIVLFRPYLVALLGICAGLFVGTVMLFSRRVRESFLMRTLIARLPFGKTVSRAYASMDAFREKPGVIAEGFLYAVGVHVLGTASSCVLTWGLHMPPAAGVEQSGSLGMLFAAILTANFVCSFASFGAVGVGQVAFAFTFENVARLRGGADLATAIQAAFFLVKAPGLFFWLTARKPHHSDIKEQVTAAKGIPVDRS